MDNFERLRTHSCTSSKIPVEKAGIVTLEACQSELERKVQRLIRIYDTLKKITESIVL